MSTRERMRRELKELAKMGETLRQERSEDGHGSGKWSYIPPETAESATEALDDGAAPSPRPSSVSVPPPAPWAAASSPDGVGRSDAGSLAPHRAEPSPRKWLLGLGAAAFLIGASLFGRTFADGQPPAGPAIVIATQAPALPPSPTPAKAAEPATEHAAPSPEATGSAVGLNTGATPPWAPPATAISATPQSAHTAQQPVGPDAARPSPKACATPTTPPRGPAAANHPAPAAPASSQSLDDMIRNAVHGEEAK